MIGQLMGYLASVLLAISLLVNGELKFRWINMFGCLAFIVYGLLINAMPVTLTNAILLLINVYQLIRYYRTTEAFDMYEFSTEEKIVGKFLRFYKNDLESYYPDFSMNNDSDDDLRFAVLRNMTLANIFIVNLKPGGEAHVKINYTIPKYRDFKVGTYLFEKKKEYFRSKGINKFIYTSVANKGHLAFLNKMGFVKEGDAIVKTL